MSSRGAEMDQPTQIHRFTWQGIVIEARYWPRRWVVSAHLEIESIAPERAAPRLPLAVRPMRKASVGRLPQILPRCMMRSEPEQE